VVKYVEVHDDTVVLSGPSVRTWLGLDASRGLSGLELIESTKIGPSCKSVKTNSNALIILCLLLLRCRRLQRHSEFLILDEQLAYPLLETPQMVLRFFPPWLRFFIPPSCDDPTGNVLERRIGPCSRFAVWLLTLLAVHNASNANSHHCHKGVSLAPSAAIAQTSQAIPEAGL
jgi:hypothetical protein